MKLENMRNMWVFLPASILESKNLSQHEKFSNAEKRSKKRLHTVLNLEKGMTDNFKNKFLEKKSEYQIMRSCKISIYKEPCFQHEKHHRQFVM